MGLKAIVDSLDNVPAELHDHYTEKDGRFVLQIEGIREHPDTAALQNAYRTEQNRRRELSDQVTALKARIEGLPDDFDAAQYEDLKARAEASDGGDVNEQVQRVRDQMQRRIDQLTAKHQNDLRDRDEKIAQKDAQLERTIIDRSLQTAMDEANIDPKHKKMLAPYLRTLGKAKVAEDAGELVALIETDMGEVPIAKFVADWAASDAGKEYVAKPTGLDSKGSDSRRMDGNPFAKQAWNKTEQGRMVQSDRAKAERLAKAAGFRTLDAAITAREPVAA